MASTGREVRRGEEQTCLSPLPPLAASQSPGSWTLVTRVPQSGAGERFGAQVLHGSKGVWLDTPLCPFTTDSLSGRCHRHHPYAY